MKIALQTFDDLTLIEFIICIMCLRNFSKAFMKYIRSTNKCPREREWEREKTNHAWS